MYPSSSPSTIIAPSLPSFRPVPSSTDTTFNVTSMNGLAFNHAWDLLHSYIDFKGEQNNFYLNTSLEIYENLEKDKTSRYEFIYPQYNLEKQISYENGNGYLKTYGSQRQYDTNIYEGIIINDFLFEGRSNYSKNGFVSNLKTLIKNVNVDANNSEIYKDEFEQSIAAVFQYNSQYPLFKESSEYNNNLKRSMLYIFLDFHFSN